MTDNVFDEVLIDDEQEVVKEKSKVGIILAKIGIALLSIILCLSITILGFSAVVCYGPSSDFKTKFVQKVTERSSTKILADIFLSDAEIYEITNG